MVNMRQGERTDLMPIGTMSQDEAAHLLNVSLRSVRRGKIVTDHGTPALIEAAAPDAVGYRQPP